MRSNTLARIACLVLATSVVALLAAAVGRADGSTRFSIANASGIEGTALTFTVTRSGDDASEMTVAWGTSGGSADDYEPASGTLTFPAGVTTQTVTVQTKEDGVHEGDETFSVKLHDASDGSIEGDGATGTITDKDRTPTAAITTTEPHTVGEGQQKVFTVKLSGPSSHEISVEYSLGGTATPGADGDYTTSPATPIVFEPRQTEKTLTVSTVNDPLDEVDETVTVTVAGGSSATVTIVDNDDPPNASVGNAEVQEGNSGTKEIKFVVQLSAKSGREVRVNWATSDGTAKAGEDYEGPRTDTLVIPAGKQDGEIVVLVKGDTAPEADETFHVNIFATPTAGVASGKGQGTGTIKNDDGKPKLTVSDAGAGEKDPGKLTFTVSLSTRPAQEISVAIATADGSASAPADYQARSGILRFRPSDFGANATKFERTFEVVIVDDAVDEPTEHLFVRLSDPVGADVDDGEGRGTIADDDTTSAFGIDDATADELETGTSTATVKIKLSPASKRTVSVGWATADGTATAGSDYEAASGTVTLEPDQTEATVTVVVKGDTAAEPNETFAIRLSGASGARIGDEEALVTIVDKTAPPSLSVSDAFGREGETLDFVVTLAGNTARTVTVEIETSDAVARAPDDYTPRRGRLTFQPGEKTKTVPVTIIDDAVAEGEESVMMTLSEPVNAVITKARGIGLIEASDQVAATPTASSSPPTTNTPPTTRSTPFLTRVAIGPKTLVATAAGAVRFTVACNRGPRVGCKGTAILDEHLVVPRNTAKAPAKKAKKPLRLGSKAFTVRVGRRGTVSIKLTKKGLALLRRKKVLKAKLTVVIREGSRSLRANPGVVTLKVATPTKKSSGPSVKVG